MGFSKFNQRVFFSFVFSFLPPSHGGVASIIGGKILWGDEGKLIACKEELGKFPGIQRSPAALGGPAVKATLLGEMEQGLDPVVQTREFLCAYASMASLGTLAAPFGPPTELSICPQFLVA